MIDSLPAQMNCIEISEPGGPEVLQPTTRAIPEPKTGEVLIQVKACGVNRPDAFQRAGDYPAPKGASDLPGLEVSGVVVATDQAANRFRAGDHVVALVPGGGYADYVTCPEFTCLPDPFDGKDWIKSAALPETAFTVWHNVFAVSGLVTGERFLVHGGSSGIGTMAIQMAKTRGAEVVATAGNKAKCNLAASLGADLSINYHEEDFVAVVEDTYGKGAINVVLDMVGGDYVDRNFKVMAQDGRMSFIAFLHGARQSVNLLPIMSKRLRVSGSTMRRLPDDLKARTAEDLEREIWPLVRQGRIAPIIHATLPLAQASEAHRMMEAGEIMGKVVLSTQSEN